MSDRSRPRERGRVGRVVDVRFVEVAFEAPVGTRMVIELEGGIRLVVVDEKGIGLAAELLDCLARERNRKGGRK